MISDMRKAIVAVGLVLALMSVGCGRYEPSPDHRPAAPTTTPDDPSETVIRCADAPRIPEDTWVNLNRTKRTVTVAWGARRGFPKFTVRPDDPTCEDRTDLRQWLRPVGPFPRFEDARIVVRPDNDCAYVGYTILSDQQLMANLEDITATRPSGQPIDWKHQTATGGPAAILARDGREVVTPDDPGGCGVGGTGDADYFDARDVQVGETVRVTFRFLDIPDDWDGEAPLGPKRVVEVPFKVVSGSRGGNAVPR